ncbi:Biotin synthase [Moorella humiferrea]|uniref:radical SAM protein n=1 Tax=Neomoorella humiferrea TaxID=676965 RepID=UPI0030D364F2
MTFQGFDFDTWLSLPTSILLNEAWRVRRQYFDNKIFFSAPGTKGYENEYYRNNRNRFVAISLTGTSCALNCDHCQKKLLHSMLSCTTPEKLLATAKELQAEGCQGILLSGGADKTGAVPLGPFMEAIKKIKTWGFKVIVHSGLVSEEIIAGLKQAGVDQVLVDVIGARETIRDVYHLDYGPEVYQSFLDLCQQYQLEVAPHIVVGLHYGRINGEVEALKIISNAQPRHVVVVVLTPLQGTPMARVTLPSVEKCGRIIALARLANPRAQLSLGCARPAGYERPLLEQFAINAGVNAIAYPSPETIRLAREMALEIEFNDWCCTLADE